MKRWAKAWLAVGVGCCVCGAALTGIGVASGGSKYVKSADLNQMDGAAPKSDNEMVDDALPVKRWKTRMTVIFLIHRRERAAIWNEFWLSY